MKTSKNKKWLFTINYEFVLGEAPQIYYSTEGFYCTDKELGNMLDLIERVIIRCNGQVLDTKISRS